jgi:HEAT repeat protein
MLRRSSIALILSLCGWVGLPAADTPAPEDREKQLQPGEEEKLALNENERFLAAVRIANSSYQRQLTHIHEMLRSEDPEAQSVAFATIARLRDPETIPWLVPLLDPDVMTIATVEQAILTASKLRATSLVPQLRKLMDHERESIRLAALNALAQMERLGKFDYLKKAQSDNTNVEAMAITELGIERVEEALEVLAANLQRDRRDHVRRMACISLTRLGLPEVGQHLINALTDRDPVVRRYAAEGLAQLDYKPAIPYLMFALEANIAGRHINRALTDLTGHDFDFDASANIVERTEAVNRCFEWWSHNADRFRQ